MIGAGSAGIFTLRALQNLDQEKYDVTCFERYSTVGGQWNYLGKERIDDDGMEVHSSMYANLKINAPKFTLGTPDFWFNDKNEPCYLTGAEVHKHLQKFLVDFNIIENIRFSTYVEKVSFDETDKKFKMKSKNLISQLETYEYLDYVIVATGHFRSPNYVSYPGQQTFPGLVIHSKGFTDARRYKGKRVLVVGSSYSAEDIAIQANRDGASFVTLTCRTVHHGLKWPKGIDERPILTKIEGSKVHFKDGTSCDYDVIIYCTGYLHIFPFMEEQLKLVTKHVLAPPLYKQVVWASNPRLFYAGMQDQIYRFSMFWLQGHLCREIIQGNIQVPDEVSCRAAIEEDQEKKLL